MKFELKKRSQDEMEFEDEIDYPADISLKERFKKFKGLKNFRTSEWKKNVFVIIILINNNYHLRMDYQTNTKKFLYMTTIKEL